MPSARLKAIGVAAILCAVPVTAHAADAVPSDAGSGWTFTSAAYLWASGITGKSGVFGLPPQDVDVSFGDIIQDLDFAFMGLGEARNGPFVLGMDLTYSKVGSTVDNPRKADTLLINKIGADSTTWMVTGYGGYTVLDTDEVQLDVIGGARLWSVNSEFTLHSDFPNIDGRNKDDGSTWVDPLAGAKIRIDVTPDIFVISWAIAGGFGVGSDLMWDVMAGAGYEFNDTFSMFAGYRAVSVDYSNDGFVYDIVQSGPLAAAMFRF